VGHEAFQGGEAADAHHDQVAGLARGHLDLGEGLGTGQFGFAGSAFEQQRLQFATTVGFHETGHAGS
jgi:hypothetical protein